MLRLICFIGMALVCACTQQKNEEAAYDNIPGYNINDPVVVHLKAELEEISGLQFYPADSSVFGITDEEGILYKIYLEGKVQVYKWQFAKNADYEDLVLVDSTFYALRSDGSAVAFRFVSATKIEQLKVKSPVKGSNEFEGMFYDPAANRVVLLCKDCKEDSDNTLTAFGLNPDTHTIDESPRFVMNTQKILNKLSNGKSRFKPSAAALHPITGDLYIVSAINSALVVASAGGMVKHVYKLNSKLFKQPEGITFTPWGDMLISNEAADIGSPNILMYKYNGATP